MVTGVGEAALRTAGVGTAVQAHLPDPPDPDVPGSSRTIATHDAHPAGAAAHEPSQAHVRDLASASEAQDGSQAYPHDDPEVVLQPVRADVHSPIADCAAEAAGRPLVLQGASVQPPRAVQGRAGPSGKDLGLAWECCGRLRDPVHAAELALRYLGTRPFVHAFSVL